MLTVFDMAIGKPPLELGLPSIGLKKAKTREEILKLFQSSRPDCTVYYLSDGSFMALSRDNENQSQTRSIVVIDDVFCIFIGTLENTSDMRRYYGLPRQATEAMVAVEIYKVLRDRAPYPPDQVIKDLQGKFAFILFDARYDTLLAARDRDGSVELHWGMAGDGSLICSHKFNIIREACGNSCASFPPGKGNCTRRRQWQHLWSCFSGGSVHTNPQRAFHAPVVDRIGRIQLVSSKVITIHN